MTTNAAVEHEPTAIRARMREEILSVAPLGLDRWPVLQAQAKEIENLGRGPIIITGCGDSFYAGLAMRYFLEEATGQPVLAMPAMDTAALPQHFARGALMVGVSVSGKVGRTIEAVQRHADAGGATVAVTSYADSDLGVLADHTLATEMRGTPGPVPGTVKYVGSLLALLALGERARPDERLLGDGEVESALTAVASMAESGGAQLDEVVSGLHEPFFAVGSGSDLGTASFGVAKFLEAAGTVGVAQDLEEWAHEQFFATRPGTTVFVHSTRPEVATRAATVAGMVQRVGGRLVVVGNEHAPHAAGISWSLRGLSDRVAPLAAWAPMALSALTYSESNTLWPFGLDVAGRMATVDSNIYVAKPKRS